MYVMAGHEARAQRILPLRMPLIGERSPVQRSNYVSELSGAKRARTTDLLHAIWRAARPPACHLCRSPSSRVPARPPPSACVAVLPCCTAAIRAVGTGRGPRCSPDQRRSSTPGYRCVVRCGSGQAGPSRASRSARSLARVPAVRAQDLPADMHAFWITQVLLGWKADDATAGRLRRLEAWWTGRQAGSRVTCERACGSPGMSLKNGSVPAAWRWCSGRVTIA